MNFVYICRDGDNEELRYSIRSLYKNTNSPNIWVVGGKPDWYIGNYLKVEQRHTKHKNARNNLYKIVFSSEIPNNFILMNDDFFIMKPIKNIPYYHGGKLIDKVNKFRQNEPKSPYTQLLSDTYNKLIKIGINDPLDYALHIPMMINKQKLSKAIIPGVSVRTMYGNMNNVGGKKAFDVKIHSSRKWADEVNHLNNKNIFLSSNDESFEILYNDILKDMFKDKSPLEK